MALHFSDEEFADRLARLRARMQRDKLDCLLLFAQESMYWLTGYDTFGFCFFQCLVVTRDGSMVLLTRSADQRQARHTSTLSDIRIWVDLGDANPVSQLKDLLFELDMLGGRIGVEFDTHGMTGSVGIALAEQLNSFAELCDCSPLVPSLRAIKSPEELVYIRKAAELADLAFEKALPDIHGGADEARILSILQGTVLEGGGDYPANEFVIGSGRDALLVRYQSGRRILKETDQLTLEWAGCYRHYHAALMRTVPIGRPSARFQEMEAVAWKALAAVEQVMKPGNTFGDLFRAHANVIDEHDMMPHRLNSCGYSLGARFAPSWMDPPMAYRDNNELIEPNMVLFQHMVLMDSSSDTAVTLGRSYLTTNGNAECLSRLPLDLPLNSG
ncbi:M24 family metallopeptidase [Roseibium sp.]|uniref:M24 family metallopeptidase n=1 Tax=Roseibium sp. TaxID=1936156 RepID=UPI003A9870DB